MHFNCKLRMYRNTGMIWYIGIIMEFRKATPHLFLPLQKKELANFLQNFAWTPSYVLLLPANLFYSILDASFLIYKKKNQKKKTKKMILESAKCSQLPFEYCATPEMKHSLNLSQCRRQHLLQTFIQSPWKKNV